jgi:hypothetical protein
LKWDISSSDVPPRTEAHLREALVLVKATEIYGHLAEDHRVREADSRLALGLPKDTREHVSEVAAKSFALCRRRDSNS